MASRTASRALPLSTRQEGVVVAAWAVLVVALVEALAWGAQGLLAQHLLAMVHSTLDRVVAAVALMWGAMAQMVGVAVVL